MKTFNEWCQYCKHDPGSPDAQAGYEMYRKGRGQFQAHSTHVLAKTGFTLIRGLLEGRLPGGPAAALELAEALHNLPEPGNAFLEELTMRNLAQLVAKYPQFRQPFAAAGQLPE